MTLTEKLNSIKAKVIVIKCGTRFYSVLLDRVQNTAKNRAYQDKIVRTTQQVLDCLKAFSR